MRLLLLVAEQVAFGGRRLGVHRSGALRRDVEARVRLVRARGARRARTLKAEVVAAASREERALGRVQSLELELRSATKQVEHLTRFNELLRKQLGTMYGGAR